MFRKYLMGSAFFLLLIIQPVLAQETLHISATDEAGSKFVAPASAFYRFTIVGGAYINTPRESQPNHPELWGYTTTIYMYVNRPFSLTPCGYQNYYGPGGWDFEMGEGGRFSTVREAEEASVGDYVQVYLNKGDYALFIIWDCFVCCFRDNTGGVFIEARNIQESGNTDEPGHAAICEPCTLHADCDSGNCGLTQEGTLRCIPTHAATHTCTVELPQAGICEPCGSNAECESGNCGLTKEGSRRCIPSNETSYACNVEPPKAGICMPCSSNANCQSANCGASKDGLRLCIPADAATYFCESPESGSSGGGCLIQTICPTAANWLNRVFIQMVERSDSE
jgi:hypothetical protein